MASNDSRFLIRGQSLRRVLLPPALAVVVVIGLLFFFGGPADDDIRRDEDLCPVDSNAIAGSAMFLFDFRKPLDDTQATLPGELLREVTIDLDRDTELLVFSLTASEGAPRALLKRLCKPYDNDDLQVEQAKDRGVALRDCNDLPAQIPSDVRQTAIRFCAQRDILAERLNVFAGKQWRNEEHVNNAYLVEALDDSRLAFTERPGPHSLYLFSDMMQHAHWYSHLDLEWEDWSYEKFAELLKERNWLFEQRADGSGLGVEVYYIPRADWTDQPRVKEAHQQFWRTYFGGAQVTFHDQTPMPAYSAQPQMNVLTEAEIAAQERAAVERLLLQIKQEQEALEREQRQLAAERQRRAEIERQRALERERQAERQRELQRELQRQQLAEEERQRAEREAQAAREEQSSLQQPAAEATPSAPQDTTETMQGAGAPPPPGTPPPPCDLVLTGGDDARRPDYPKGGQTDFGSAEITVRYLVDESGETVDDEVTVIRESSSATRGRYFFRFASAAIRKAQSWKFSFVEQDGGACSKRQTRTTSFQFRFRYI